MKYFVFLSSILLVVNGYAQGKKAAKDSVVKVVYSEIIKVDSSNRFDLFKRASKWVESQKFEVEEENALTGKISARNRFEVFSEKGVLAKPNGDFTHDFIIEVKDGKYRYTFTNFTYRKYKQDRQDLLKYIPEKSSKPIEDKSAPGWYKQWGKNKMQVSEKVNSYIVNLREAMKYVPPTVPAQQKPKEEW